MVALVGGGGAGNLDGVMPGAVHLIDDHQLFVAGAVGVPPAGAAVARRTARHRADLRVALVEGSGAGNLDGFTPDTVHLAAHERLDVRGVVVAPADAAVACRGARHRADLRDRLVEGGGAGDFDGGMPGALDFADDERLSAPEAVGVPPAGAAVSRRTARYRVDLRVTAPVEGGSAGNFPGSPPRAVQSSGPGSTSRAGSRHRAARPGHRCQAGCTGYRQNHRDGTSSAKHHQSLPYHRADT